MDRFGRVLIPKKVRSRLGLVAGEEMALAVEGDKIVLERELVRDIVVQKGSALILDVKGQDDIYSALEWQREKRHAQILFGEDDD